MFAFLKRSIAKRSIADLAAIELDEAERSLMAAQTGAEYAAAMIDYHRARIERLRDIIASKEQA